VKLTALATLAGLWLQVAAAQAVVGDVGNQSSALRPINTVTVKTFDVDDGLPQNTVHAIARDADGYLWAATWEGVARFNGQGFRVYDHSAHPQMGQGGVRSLLAAADGSLWLGQSENGAARLYSDRWTTGLRHPDLETDQVLALVEDGEGRVYAGTADNGVIVVDNGQQRRIGERGHRVFALAIAASQRLLLATHRGLEVLPLPNGELHNLGGGQVRAVIETTAGEILAGGEQGLFRLVGSELHSIELPRAMRQVTINVLAADRVGRLWVGTQANGLYRISFDASGLVAETEQLGAAEGLPNPRVLSLLIDGDRSLWVGTNGGLTQVLETAIERVGIAQGVDSPFVRVVAERPNGEVVIGTSGGLYRYGDDGMVTRDANRDLANSSITAFAEDPSGDLWVGTYAAGVRRLRDGKVVFQLDRDAGLPQDQVRVLLAESASVLWVGTSEGLARYADGELTVIDLFPKASPDFVLSLANDPQGNLWVGTAIGLARLGVDGQVQVFDQSQDYPGLDTFDIQFEADGLAWLATDAGLVRMRDGKFQSIGRAHGLPSDTLFRVLIEPSGEFWLTSNRGLARVERGAIEAVLDGRADTLRPLLLTAESGLSATQCNGGTQPAGWLGKDGSLWIPTSNGVSRLYGKDFPPPPSPLVPVVLEQVSVDGIAVEQPISLRPSSRRIEFGLAGLVYSDAERVLFSHWLDGYDDGFGPLQPESSIGYTNLPPGDYVLRVKARADAYQADGPELQVPFVVQATLWQKRWVRVLLLALVGALVLGMYSLRLRAVRRNERRLQAMVAERTTELSERAKQLDDADREKSRLLEELRYQAGHDSLTDLPNRSSADAHLRDCFAAMTSDGSALCVALLDVDHFKQINDKHSHQAGDRALSALAGRMRSIESLWCARFGGEEFLLVAQLPAGQSVRLFEQLRSTVGDGPIAHYQDSPLSFTVSIGWVEAVGFADSTAALAEADRRLYRAKAAGRNRVVPAPHD